MTRKLLGKTEGRFDADPRPYLALAPVPPSVPRAARHRELISWSEHPYLAVDEEGDTALFDEEIAQEAFARAYEGWDRVSRMASPSGYVYRIRLNLNRHRLRATSPFERAGRSP
jgi:hypothetical protein